MVDTNVLIKCLGKSLKTDIKFIAICKFKFYDEFNKEIKYTYDQSNNKQILCLGRDKVFLLQSDMNKIIESFTYESLNGIEIDSKNNETFNLWLDSKLIVNTKLKKYVYMLSLEVI